jgi:soluble lytic murein transglycosylase
MKASSRIRRLVFDCWGKLPIIAVIVAVGIFFPWASSAGATSPTPGKVSPSRAGQTAKVRAPVPVSQKVPAQASSTNAPLSMQSLAPVYGNQAVLKAVAKVDAQDWSGAREALLSLAAGGRLPEQPLRLRFLLGLSCLNAGDMLGAVAVLDGLESDLPLMADRILLIRGTALAALGRLGDAADALALVPSTSPIATQARDARIDALVGSGRFIEAVELLRKATEKAAGDPGLASRLADVLRQVGDVDGAEQAMKDALGKASATGRRTLRKMIGILETSRPVSGDADALEAARNLLDAQRSEEASRAATALLGSSEPGIKCEARLVRAGALTKLRRHQEAIVDYRGVINECDNGADTPRVLFNATRSAYRAGESAEGDAYASRLAKGFPTASFNDDVSIMRARQAIGRGDSAAAERILIESVKAWPAGDMADESRWLLAWAAWTSGKRDKAIARCREGRSAEGVDPDQGSRFAYWEARALQKAGQRKDAEAVYSDCVRTYPMTYYAVLSLQRLAAIRKSTPDAQLKILTAGMTRPGAFFTPSNPASLNEGAAARILWLSQTGLTNLAREEAALTAERDVDADWLAAMLLDTAGMYTQSHRLATKLIKTVGSFWPDQPTAGYYRLAWPRPFRTEVERAALESSIDPLLIWAVIRQESAFVSGVESRANAIGLMQLILPTAQSMAKILRLEATPDALRRPDVNVRLGAAYLSRLIRDLHEPLLAIPGYNAGGGAIQRKLTEMPGASLDELVESIGATETREYARKVFENWAVYRLLYGSGEERLPRVRLEPGKAAKDQKPAVSPPSGRHRRQR